MVAEQNEHGFATQLHVSTWDWPTQHRHYSFDFSNLTVLIGTA
jgi:hypothetical protein